MGLFKLDEVLQLAMQAEETGRLLYESLAKEASQPAVTDLCGQLAAQEKAHYARFEAMRQNKPPGSRDRRMSLEEMDFVRSMIEDRVVPTEAEARRLVRQQSLAEVLDRAIQAERDSVLFYRQILAAVDPSEQAIVKQIIQEEQRHEQSLVALKKQVAD